MIRTYWCYRTSFVLLFIFLLISSATSHAQFQATAILEGSRYGCGLGNDLNTTLLKFTTRGAKIRQFKKSIRNRRRKSRRSSKKIKDLKVLIASNSGSKRELKKQVKREIGKRKLYKSEISFLMRCRDRDLTLFENPSPSPSQSPTELPTPKSSPSPSVSSSPKATPSGSPSASVSQSPSPSASPSVSPSTTPTPGPSGDAFQDVNFESAQVHPLAITSDESLLLYTNTADSRLEFFSISNGALSNIDSIIVGHDPVSVRLRTASEAWVVNAISHTVSIVDLTQRRVINLLHTGEGPTDVAFSNGKAFVTISKKNQIEVYDLSDLTSAPQIIELMAKMPWQLEVTSSGSVVCTSLFTFNTSIVHRGHVSDPDGPYKGLLNPVPNSGSSFVPPKKPTLPIAPTVNLIVERIGSTWRDENNADWTSKVWTDPQDNDVCVIDPQDLSVSCHTLEFNTTSALAINPSSGELFLAGTDSQNQIRFEPNLKGNFVRMKAATLNTATGEVTHSSLNPHLTFTQKQIAQQSNPNQFSQTLKDRSVANPRAIAISRDGQRVYLVGQGTNNLVVLDDSGDRLSGLDPLTVGRGPSGVALLESQQRLYVANSHEGTISIIDTANWQELERASYFDPTPEFIKTGRKFLYDTKLSSGMGTMACASCHVDGRMDMQPWDLGNPTGEMVTVTQACAVNEECTFHPMKGAMTTQSLADIFRVDPVHGKLPFHWRGDNQGFEDFNGAFTNLHGNHRMLSTSEMEEFADFVASIRVPPNPNREIDNTLKASLGGSSPAVGEAIFMRTDSCNKCHKAVIGGRGPIGPAAPPNFFTLEGGPNGIIQPARVDNVRYRFDHTYKNTSGLQSPVAAGILHDGATSPEHMFGYGLFRYNPDINLSFGILESLIIDHSTLSATEKLDPDKREEQVLNLVSFLRSFPTVTHSGVGASMLVTFPNLSQSQLTTFGFMLNASNAGDTGIVFSLRRSANSPEESFLLINNVIVGDNAGEQYSLTEFMNTFSNIPVLILQVPSANAVRVALDRDEDNLLNGDDPNPRNRMN